MEEEINVPRTTPSPHKSHQPKPRTPPSAPRGPPPAAPGFGQCHAGVVTTSSASTSAVACKTSLIQSFKAGKLKIKEESGDEIKDYAETTMNELLGWYGYEQAVHREDTQNLDLKRFAPNGERVLGRPGPTSSPTRGSTSKKNMPEDNSRTAEIKSEDLTTARNQTIVAALNLIPKRVLSPDGAPVEMVERRSPGESRPDQATYMDSGRDSTKPDSPNSGSLQPTTRQQSSSTNMAQQLTTEGAATCEPTQSTPCLWCQKSTGDKAFSLKMDDGATKLFCTDLCFTMCRRASFKKNKVCDWCKNIKNTVTYVDFQDGEQQLQFCGEQCLNQYKMNIFCKETQEHLETIKSAMGATTTPPKSTSNKQIIITPELWKGPRGEDLRKLEVGTNKMESTGPANKVEIDGPISKICPKERDKLSERKLKMRARAESSHSDRRSTESRLSSTMASYLSNQMKHRPHSQSNGDSRDQFSSPHSYGEVINNESKDSLQFCDRYLKSPKKEPPMFSPMMPKSLSRSSDGPLISSIGSKMFSSSSLKDRPKHSQPEASHLQGYTLATSPSSEVSSTPRSSITSHFPPAGATLPSPGSLPASQLLSSLGPSLPPWMYNPLLNPGLAGLPGLELALGAQGALPPVRPPGPPGGFLPGATASVSSSTQQTRDIREAPSANTLSAPHHLPPPPGGLPIRPPFPLGGLPSNMLGMMSPGMPHLMPMAPNIPNSILPTLSGLAGGMLPPNTLMVPYPVIIPLPIPLPLTVPIPITCDKDGTPIIPDVATSAPPVVPHITIKQEKDTEDSSDMTDKDDKNQHDLCPNHLISGLRPIEKAACSSQITCACCQTGGSKEGTCTSRLLAKRRLSSSPPEFQDPHQRHHVSTPSTKHSSSHFGHCSSLSSSSDIQSDAMDLSKDKHSRSKGSTSLSGLDLNRNNTLLRDSPSSGSEGSTHHYLVGGSTQSVDSAYSARRSLILDAPSQPERVSHSPGDEKRLFIGGLSKDHAYGKRRCIRPRIRTK